MTWEAKINKADYKMVDEGLRTYILRIYNHLSVALLITGFAAWAVIYVPSLSNLLFIREPASHQIGLTGFGTFMALLPLFIAFYFSFRIFSLTNSQALMLLWIYAAAIGISIAPVAFIYTGSSIARTFFICASLFGGMSIYGYLTKRNLLSWSGFLVMGIWGIIILSLTNIFFRSPAIYFVESLIGVGIFMLLIAVDTQKIKSLYYNAPAQEEVTFKLSIIATLSLYMDIINLFLYLLRFMGDQRKQE